MLSAENQPPSVRPWNRLFLLVAGMVVLGAATLRFMHLGQPCLWLDEVITATIARRGPSEILRFTRHDTGPLFFSYCFEWLLAAFEPVEFWVRFPTALFGTAAVVMMFPAARAIGLSRAGSLLAGGLLAFSSHHIYYSREARGYALLTLTALASFVLLNHWVCSRSTPGRKSVLYLLAFAITSLVGLFTSYFFAPFLAALFLYGGVLLIRKKTPPPAFDSSRRQLLVFAICGAVLAVLYATWCFIAFPVMSAYNNAAVPRPDVQNWLQQTAQQWLTSRFAWALPTSALLLAVAGVAAYFQRRLSGWLLTTGALLLSIVVLTLGQRAHFLAPRYLLALYPFFLIQLAGVFHVAIQLIPTRTRLFPAASGVAAFLLITAWAFPNIRDYRVWYSLPKQDWKAVSSYLDERIKPGDLIVPGIDATWVCLDLYLPAELKAQLTPNQSGTAASLPALARSGKRIWYVEPAYASDEAPSLHEWLQKYFALAGQWTGINPAMTIYLYCSDRSNI